MQYFEKKSLAITVSSWIAVLAIVVIIKILGIYSPALIAVLSGVLFVASIVFYILYFSAYSKETNDDEIWDFGFSGAAKRIPWFYSGAYKRNLLALNFYLWLFLAFLSSYLLLLL